jgi:hypothetical protein
MRKSQDLHHAIHGVNLGTSVTSISDAASGGPYGSKSRFSIPIEMAAPVPIAVRLWESREDSSRPVAGISRST